MDTKLKKSRLFTKTSKFMATIGILACVVTSCFCMFAIFGSGSAIGISPLNSDNYFSTNAFYDQYSQLVRDVVNVNLAYKDENYIKAGKALPEDIIIRNFMDDYGIPREMEGLLLADQLSQNPFAKQSQPTRISQVEVRAVAGNGEYPVTETIEDAEEEEADLTPEEREEFLRIYDENYDRYRQRAIQEQLADFKASKEELESFVNFKYYLVNNSNNKIISNMPLEEIKKQDIYTVLDGPYVEGFQVDSSNYYYYYDESMERRVTYYYNNFLGSIGDILQENNATLYVAVPQPLISGDNFYAQNAIFESRKDIIPNYMGVLAFCGITGFLLTLYVVLSAGRSERGGEVTLRAVDKIFNDVQTVFTFFAYLVGGLVAGGLFHILLMTSDANWILLLKFLITCIAVTLCVIGLSYLTSMSRQIKARQLFKNTMVSAFIRKVGSLFSGRTFKGWIVFWMFLYAGINMVLFGLLISVYGFGEFVLTALMIAAFNILSAVIFSRALTSLTKIMVAVKETSKGNLNCEIDLSEISPSFINFATDVSNMQSGLKNAVAEAVKGERMKADLITNVSHDLKTPLTSIVTYVDLLKKEDLQNETAKGYVQILDEKSGRLKQLIEDLIEASKASSGNVSVHEEKVDLRQLVMQASGEFEEKIKNAGLNFRVSSSGQTLIRADGKHMWRIVENLITNAIKYSMSGSRVYIDIMKTESLGILVMKNMSAQPIEVRPDQLMERFVRGEESRTTEGSGLGLSIAKSLTDVQGGDMEISVDGDLFKVTIKMPLWPQEEKIAEPDPENGNGPDDGAEGGVLEPKVHLHKA